MARTAKAKSPRRHRHAHQGAGQGRAHAAWRSRSRGTTSATIRRTRPASPTPTTTRCASAISDREAVSRVGHCGFAVAEGRRGAVGAFQESAARGADAVARQRVRRTGRARLRRPDRALSQARRRQDRLLAEPKIDGLSMSLRYEGGELVTAATRGDGAEGEDVTANIRTLEDVPQKLKGRDVPDICEVRGEVYMTKKAFLALNKKQVEAGEAPLRQSAQFGRGLAAAEGPRHHRVAAARFFAYAWGEMSAMPADTQNGMIHWLERCGFRTNPLTKLCHSRRAVDRVPSQDRGAARRARLRHRRRRLQGRPDRLAGAARLRLAHARAGRSRTNSPPSAP